MRSARILYKNEAAGVLSQFDDGSFEFRYHEQWISDPTKPAISLTLPKRKQAYHSAYMLPFFYHMLPEGANKKAICYHLRLDEKDDFGILMATAYHDAIGAVQVQKITNT